MGRRPRTTVFPGLAGLALAGAPRLSSRCPAGPGTEIGHEGQRGGLPAGFETSGVDWRPGRGAVIAVGDGGLAAELSPEGGVLAARPLAGDLEAVTVADPVSSRVGLDGMRRPASFAGYR